jgi:hypothetical protein
MRMTGKNESSSTHSSVQQWPLVYRNEFYARLAGKTEHWSSRRCPETATVQHTDIATRGASNEQETSGLQHDQAS